MAFEAVRLQKWLVVQISSPMGWRTRRLGEALTKRWANKGGIALSPQIVSVNLHD